MEELKNDIVCGYDENCCCVPTHYLIEDEKARYWCTYHDLKHAKNDFKTKPMFKLEDVQSKVKVVLDQISNIKHSRFAQDSHINHEKMKKWIQKIESSLEVEREEIKSFDKKEEVKYLRLCEKIMDDGRSFLHHPLYFKYLRDKELDPSIEENPESVKGLRNTIELLTKENTGLREELKSSITDHKQDKLLKLFGSSKIFTKRMVNLLDVILKSCRLKEPKSACLAIERSISDLLNSNQEVKYEKLDNAEEQIDEEVLKVSQKYKLKIGQSLLPSQVVDISNDFGERLLTGDNQNRLSIEIEIAQAQHLAFLKILKFYRVPKIESMTIYGFHECMDYSWKAIDCGGVSKGSNKKGTSRAISIFGDAIEQTSMNIDKVFVCYVTFNSESILKFLNTFKKTTSVSLDDKIKFNIIEHVKFDQALTGIRSIYFGSRIFTNNERKLFESIYMYKGLLNEYGEIKYGHSSYSDCHREAYEIKKQFNKTQLISLKENKKQNKIEQALIQEHQNKRDDQDDEVHQTDNEKPECIIF